MILEIKKIFSNGSTKKKVMGKLEMLIKFMTRVISKGKTQPAKYRNLPAGMIRFFYGYNIIRIPKEIASIIYSDILY